MGKLSGKAAIVTGGTRGIGRATAELFASEGADLALCARTPEALEQTAGELIRKHGVKVFTRTASILDRDGMDGFVNAAGAALGRIDILVNNAGASEQRAAGGSRQQV